MPTTTDSRIESLAESCMHDMGDIFWDFDSVRDASGQFADPRHVAIESVKKTLKEFADQVNISAIYPAILREEYETILSELPESPANGTIIESLVRNADWTDQGAREVVQLARRYGWSILRSALALADAMGIEVGEAGL